MSDIFAHNGAEGAGWAQPAPINEPKISEIPAELRRSTLPRLPRLSEPEMVRHYTWLSVRNFGIDTGLYPLGSCTMKHNPRLNETIAANPNLLGIHPEQPEEQIQGLLAMLHELQNVLADISGMAEVTLQPVAGAQGEFTAIRVIQEYHRANEELQRDEIIVPDSAHGTNPASAAMAGYKIIEVPSTSEGLVDLAALRQVACERTAAMMVTNPNTLGIFEPDIEEACQIVHDAGGQMYYDGANFNAILGKTSPGLMGFDAVHFNLHKTFSTPHGGGGPGAGPIGVAGHLAPYLPTPIVGRRPLFSLLDEVGVEYISKLDKETLEEIEVRSDLGVGDRWWYHWKDVGSLSIGKVHGWNGNIGILVRAWAYWRRYGRELERMSEHAVLNANYLRHVIKHPNEEFANIVLPRDGGGEGLVKHEFTLAFDEVKEKVGVSGMDIAKRLLDKGFMAPTTYFPLIVPECLMVEPTETESMEELDRFAAALHEILAENPELIRGAPHETVIGRVDEVKAARDLILRHPMDDE